MTNETKTVDAVELWYVEWTSRYDKYCNDTQKEFEAFPSKEDAENFAESLRQAFKLIRHTSQTRVSVYKRED